MRITSELLFKIAQDFVDSHRRSNHDLLAAYLQGSVLKENPLLGGATDVDLVLILNSEPAERREIVRMTEEVHLDIAYHSRSLYKQARELRLHPWLGPTIFNCKILYDPQHFVDFVQASVRGQFYLPENIMARAQGQIEKARQIWFSFQLNPPAATPEILATYLKAVEHTANGLASLNGPPLPDRRLLLDFPQRAAALDRPGLAHGLVGLLGGSNADRNTLRSWLPDWQEAYQALSSESAPAKLHPYRLHYYLNAMKAILDSQHSEAVLWLLVSTWNRAICLLPNSSPLSQKWQETGEKLGLLGEQFRERIEALDAFLDLTEETLENWARQHGVES